MFSRHSLALLLVLTGCASSPEPNDSLQSNEAALTSAKNPGAVDLTRAVRDHAVPLFLHCRSAPGERPRFEIDVHSRSHIGAATVVFRQYSGPRGAAREFALPGTLEGIPRAGDLQGGVTFELGSEHVAFDYFAETEDDVTEIAFRGHTIALRCTAVF